MIRADIGSGAEGTALIVAVELPPLLEQLRQRGVADASVGLPAHVTLLYPFLRHDAIDEAVLARITSVLARHAAFEFRLTGPGRWPGAVYAALEPEQPFRALQTDLAATFPEHPLHGGTHPFVPHISIAVGEPADAPSLMAAAAWKALPAALVATQVELILREPRMWRTGWRFPLGVR